MNYIIFCISVIGIFCVCFTMSNYNYLYEEKSSKGRIEIVLVKDDVDYVEKKEIIDKIINGNYDRIMDIVDNMRIN